MISVAIRNETNTVKESRIQTHFEALLPGPQQA